MNLDINFIFPPFNCPRGSLHSPHIACPLLNQICSEQGIKSDYFDLNIFTALLIANDAIAKKIINNCGNISKQKSIQIKKLYNELTADDYNSQFNFIDAVYGELLHYPKTIEECLENRNYASNLFKTILKIGVEDCLEKNPKAVGLSVAFGEQLPSAILICDIIREIRPKTKIYLGGSQINLLSSWQIDALAKSNLFNAIILGNAEEEIANVITELSNSKEMGKVLQLKPINKNIINKLSRINFKNMEYYFPPYAIPLLIGKGCAWGNCTFCDYIRLFNKHEFIIKNAKITAEEMAFYFAQDNVFSFSLSSDSISPSWVLELCKELKERNLKIPFTAYMLHDENINDNFFITLKERCFANITFGTESTNNRVLKMMGKKARFDVIEDNIKKSSKHRIIASTNIIPDFPTITYDEAMGVFEDIKKLKENIFYLNTQSFDLTYGTKIYQYPEKFGLKINKTNLKKTNHGYHGVEILERDSITETEREKVLNAFTELKKEINDNKQSLLKNLVF